VRGSIRFYLLSPGLRTDIGTHAPRGLAAAPLLRCRDCSCRVFDARCFPVPVCWACASCRPPAGARRPAQPLNMTADEATDFLQSLSASYPSGGAMPAAVPPPTEALTDDFDDFLNMRASRALAPM
jgi:hypothetical protein